MRATSSGASMTSTGTRESTNSSPVKDWEWSSFPRFVEWGEDALNGGGTDPTPGWNAPEWGE